MAAKDKAKTLGLPVQNGDSTYQMQTIGMACIRFLIGFLMSAGRAGASAAPFGVAAVAEAGTGLNGMATLAGVCLGYLTTGGLEWGIRYVAAAVLAFTVQFIFQDARFCKHPAFMPLSASAVMLLTGMLASFTDSNVASGAVFTVGIESLLAGGAAFFFREALSKHERTTEAAETRHDAALIVFCACALMALSRVTVLSVISIGRLLALVLVMTSAMKGGSMAGAAAGTAFGIAMDAASGGAPFFSMAYAFAGLVAGVFSRFGRLGFLVAFIMADALAVFCAWGYTVHIDALFEVFASSVIFMLIPPATLAKVSALVQPLTPGAGESGLRRYASRRVDGIARAYGDVCAVVRRNTEPVNDNDIARVFDRAADAACIRCKNKNECWTKSYMETLDALNSATSSMMKRGRLEEQDIPEYFRQKCTGMPAFVSAVNGELRAMLYRRQYSLRMEESRATAWAQYEDFAGILQDVARELGSINGADPLSERRLMRYLRSLDIEADAAVFRDSGGRLRAVIESGRLQTLTTDPAYLDKLSAVLGVRLCRPNTAGEGRLTLLEAEPLAVSVGIAAMKKKGESVSGDRGTYFKTDAGSLCVILSDGMGAGQEAAKESIEAVAILEKFLRSGVNPATAMKILNSVMLLRNGEEWGFATVDLMCVDLFSGEACFYKYGAAPSFVKNGKNVRRISGESLAAGLISGEGAVPDMVRMRLKPGSLAVIASDGVIPGDGDEWLRDMMRASGEKDMKTMAREVLRKASDEYGNTDDMTVLAVRVDART